MVQASDPYVKGAPPSREGARVTELIVHGVGGAPPTDLLDDFHPERVSGDRHAGFYRPKEPPERDGLDPEQYPREAFAWGGLTSGDSSRALWFLLLPFALMNASGWMHPPGPDSERPYAARSKIVLRLLAALGTVMAVVMFAHLAMDLVGYQCGWRYEACRDTHWWLSWLDGGFFVDHPARVIAAASLVPLGGLTLFWGAGWLSVTRFEEYVVRGKRQPELSPDPDLPLDHNSFWRGAKPVRRLRRLHFQLGVATTAVTLATTAALLTAAGWSLWVHLAVWGSAALVIGLLGLIAHPSATVSAAHAVQDGALRLWAWVAAWALYALAVGVSIWGIAARDREDSTPRLDGLIPVETLLTGTQVLVGFVLFLWLWRRGTRGSFLRLGPFVAQLLGWFMLISLWAGSGIRLADWFGDGVADTSRFWFSQEATCAMGEFCYPIWFEDAAVAFAGVLIVGALLVAWTLRPWARVDTSLLEADFKPSADNPTPPGLDPPRPWDEGDEARARSIAKLYAHSRLATKADGVMTGVLVIGVAAFLVISPIQAGGWRFWSWLVTGSGWLVAFVPIGVVLLVRIALRNPSARRGIGGVFDVLTFFPRRTHPFAPPCYGERAVPQLAWRLGWLAEDDRGVVVRAHSQGTALTAATLLADGTQRERVALMTYGSPLVMLYQRHFPAYFGAIVARTAAGFASERSWVHLHAHTDVLGCRLEPESNLVVQHRVLDPHRWDPTQDGDPAPSPLAHSTYHTHPDADAWARHLMLRLAGDSTTEPPVRDDPNDTCDDRPAPPPSTSSEQPTPAGV